MNILKTIFTGSRVVGVVGETNSGKSNNIIFLLDNFRKSNPDSNVAIYGFKEEVADILRVKYKVDVLSTLEHISDCRNTLIILDEFQKLKLGDRRYKDLTNEFFDFIHHNNNWVVLSSPNLAEFNKMICNKIKNWLFKALIIKRLVNGSEVKRIIETYQDCRKSLGRLNIGKGEMLFYSQKLVTIIRCDYMPLVDMKTKNVDIFDDVIVKKKTVKRTKNVKNNDKKKEEVKCQETKIQQD